MTAAQTIMIRLSTCRQQLNELLGVEDRSAAQHVLMEALTAEVSKREPELRAALAAEDDPQEKITKTGDPEQRERRELRAKTGIADFLRAAVGGSAVVGAAAEYASACGVPSVGHLPMSLFAGSVPPVEERAITPGVAVKGALQSVIPYLFERSAAASLGIEMPSVPSGQVQIAKVGTAPPSDTLALDGTAPATAAAVSLVNQSPVRIAGSFEVRVEDLAVMPTLESALSEAMQGSLSNELDEQTSTAQAASLTDCSRKRPMWRRPRALKHLPPELRDSQGLLMEDTPTTWATFAPSSAPKPSRSTLASLPTPTKATCRCSIISRCTWAASA